MKPGLLMLPSAVSDSRVHNILPNRIDTDFQFSRASAATRVNHQGLIENVGYFSDELVRNGNFSELGPELVTNGDFATDSDWIKGDGWTISGGTANCDGSQSVTTNFFQSAVISDLSKTYRVEFTLSNYTAGTIKSKISNSAQGVVRSANGTYVDFFSGMTNTTLTFTANENFIGSIDNVSVKQVDPDGDWILGTGWSFGDNKVIFDGGADAAVTQSNTVEPNTLYRASFTVADKTTGSLQLRLGNSGVVDVTVTDNGNFSFDLTTDASGTSVYFRAIGGFDGSISSVSVKQIFGDKPRLDYDPTNPTCPHLLLEPQSTNLVTFSEDFSQWAKQSGGTGSAPVLTSGYTSPDGTNNAYKVSFNKGTGTTTSDYSILASNAWSTQSNTASFYIKADSPQKIVFRNSSNWQLVDVTTEWQRVSKTDTGNSIQLGLRDGYGISGIPNTSEVYIFGAQAETTAYATSYIPTAGATETRVAEVCNNAGNADTFNSEEGVLYCEIAALADDLTFRNISVGDGGVDNVVRLNYNTTSNRISFINRVGGSNTAFINYNATDITQYQKVAFKFKLNDFSVFANGLQVGTDTSGAVNAANIFNTLKLDQGDGGSPFYGKVKSLATYNRAFTDTELYTITSTQYSAYSGMVAALGNYTIPC